MAGRQEKARGITTDVRPLQNFASAPGETPRSGLDLLLSRRPGRVKASLSILKRLADFLGCSSPRRESISVGEESRDSDEAIVSDDPMGQHNPLAS